MDTQYDLASQLNELGTKMREAADARNPRLPFKDGYTLDLKVDIRELDSGFVSVQHVTENGQPQIHLETAHLDSHELAGRLMAAVASRLSGLLRDNGRHSRKASYTLELKFDVSVVSCEKESSPEKAPKNPADNGEDDE